MQLNLIINNNILRRYVMEKQVGNISVDAGLCWVGDPCYLIQSSNPDGLDNLPKEIENWPNFIQSLGTDDPVIKSFNHKRGHEGLGVCVSSGIGDGLYPVFATVEDIPGWGERVTSVRIDFKNHFLLNDD